MIPIAVDPRAVVIALVGRGELLAKRLAWLRAGEARHLIVFTDEPLEDPEATVRPLPKGAWPMGFDLVWITGLPLAEARPIAAAARTAGALVNVEDVLDACSFHTPAVVRRGDLVVGISTGGRSPGLAARLRRWLDAELGPEWGARLDHLAAKRDAWRRKPRDLAELTRLTDAAIDAKGWLQPEQRP